MSLDRGERELTTSKSSLLAGTKRHEAADCDDDDRHQVNHNAYSSMENIEEGRGGRRERSRAPTSADDDDDDDTRFLDTDIVDVLPEDFTTCERILRLVKKACCPTFDSDEHEVELDAFMAKFQRFPVTMQCGWYLAWDSIVFIEYIANFVDFGDTGFNVGLKVVQVISQLVCLIVFALTIVLIWQEKHRRNWRRVSAYLMFAYLFFGPLPLSLGTQHLYVRGIGDPASLVDCMNCSGAVVFRETATMMMSQRRVVNIPLTLLAFGAFCLVD